MAQTERNLSDYSWRRFDTSDLEDLKLLYHLLEFQIFHPGDTPKKSQGHLQPITVKNHLDTIPGVADFVSGKTEKLDLMPASRGYMRWMFQEYLFNPHASEV